MSLWPFKKSTIVSEAMAQWHKDKFDWLVSTFGIATDFENRELVLPEPRAFRSGGKTGHDLAVFMFDQIKKYAGMPDFYVALVPTNDAPPDYEGENMIRPVHGSFAAGTFSAKTGNTVIITYEEKMLNEPMKLVSTLAHELSHYLLASTSVPLPVDKDEEEFLTDLTSVFLGFGVFMANTAFQFDQFNDGNIQGWKTSRLGYLPENDLVYATALFIRRKGL
jgi:hypothetical protein